VCVCECVHRHSVTSLTSRSLCLSRTTHPQIASLESDTEELRKLHREVQDDHARTLQQQQATFQTQLADLAAQHREDIAQLSRDMQEELQQKDAQASHPRMSFVCVCVRSFLFLSDSLWSVCVGTAAV
jgi:hypothetical protein